MITFDCETKSYADLTQVGAYAYAQHVTTEVICAAYKIEDEDTQTWWPGKVLRGQQSWGERGKPVGEDWKPFYHSFPRDLAMALQSGMPIEAHNVAFEKSIWKFIFHIEHHWPMVPAQQWRDTMAVAAYYALPMALDKLSRALGFGGKNPDGGRLITKYSKLHLPTAKDHIPDHEWVEWRDMTKTERDANPGAKEAGGYYCEDFQKFVKYCVDDVEQEYAISNFLGDLPDDELEVFLLDQEINERGILLDKNSIEDALAVVEQRAEELAKTFKDITGLNPTQRDAIMRWFAEQGYELENLQADYLEELFDDTSFNLKGKALEALRARVKYNKASTKKLDAMLRQCGRDGRAYFQVRYHGASTGRWTGSGFQPLNLVKSYEELPPDMLVSDLSFRDPKLLDMIYGDAMEAVSKASRHHIKASPGCRLIAADFVSIEAVLLSCLAGEEWKIEAFRRGDPIYELMGCKIHNLPQSAIDLALRDKKAFKDQYPGERFDGKTGELAFGYQGALGAWRKFDSSDKHSDERVVEICKAWRKEHPAIVQFWRDLEWASIEAVRYPGDIAQVGQIAFEIVDEWLAMHLPDGKRIWYWGPQLQLAPPAWHKPAEKEACADGTCDCEDQLKLTYMAQKEGQWKRVSTYGGKLAENATQATSRQVLVPAMKRLSEAGYPIILTIYDEIVADTPEGFGSLKEFTQIMAQSPGQWATGWPIGVDAWEGQRYKK